MISLPLMNNLCKRWILPEHIKKDCDLYFLRNLSDQEFVQSLKHSADGNDLIIQEYGISFTVIFQHGADKVYTRNGELAKRNEPNNTNYWCSFRSITFNWQGVNCVKSYVLVQVDKGNHSSLDSVKEKETTRARAVGTPRAKIENPKANPNIQTYTEITYFTSFAERSQPIERIEED